jgi:hypothetical protein
MGNSTVASEPRIGCLMLERSGLGGFPFFQTTEYVQFESHRNATFSLQTLKRLQAPLNRGFHSLHRLPASLDDSLHDTNT